MPSCLWASDKSEQSPPLLTSAEITSSTTQDKVKPAVDWQAALKEANQRRQQQPSSSSKRSRPNPNNRIVTLSDYTQNNESAPQMSSLLHRHGGKIIVGLCITGIVYYYYTRPLKKEISCPPVEPPPTGRGNRIRDFLKEKIDSFLSSPS